jgi:parallel beta-helix repeat protein
VWRILNSAGSSRSTFTFVVGAVVLCASSSTPTHGAAPTTTGLAIGQHPHSVAVRSRAGRAVHDAQAASSAPSYGPQRSITCPAGAVDIRPGSSIQRIVDFSPGATTFCIKAGVYYLNDSITPKTGDVFVGEYGAILDGAGWTTAIYEAGAFRAHSQNIDDVTIRNLEIRNMPQRGIHTYSSGNCANGKCKFSTAGADRWIVEYNDIHHNVTGIEISNDMIVRNNYIHHNVGPDPNGANGRLRGGGVEALLSQRVLFENNEIAYNGPEMKMASLSPNTIARGNWSHHNLGSGIWFDGENPGSLIENNIVEDNALMGIFYEISGQGIIRNNTIRRNGDNGILIATSHGVEIYGNALEGNFRGINYFVDCSVVGSPHGGEIGEEIYMQDVSAHDNTITVGARSGSFANGLSYDASCAPGQLAPYLDGSKKLTFTRNTYRVPSLTGKYWLWGDTKNWSEWQSTGREVDGVIAPQPRQ